MNKFVYQFGVCNKVIDNICSMIERGVLCDHIPYKELYDELWNLLPLIPAEFALYKERLERVLLPQLKLTDVVQTNPYGHQSIIRRSGINPFVFGQIIATRCYVRDSLEKPINASLWQNIHNDVTIASKDLFENGHFAEAVENAVLRFIVRVKRIVKDASGVSIDGTSVMQKAFSVNNPIIKVADFSSKTSEDIQQGIMDMSVGVVKSIRNPKVHELVSYTRREAVQKLHMISFLMDTIDTAEIVSIEKK